MCSSFSYMGNISCALRYYWLQRGWRVFPSSEILFEVSGCCGHVVWHFGFLRPLLCACDPLFFTLTVTPSFKIFRGRPGLPVRKSSWHISKRIFPYRHSPSVSRVMSSVWSTSSASVLIAFSKRDRSFLPQLSSQMNRLALSMRTIVHPEDSSAGTFLLTFV